VKQWIKIHFLVNYNYIYKIIVTSVVGTNSLQSLALAQAAKVDRKLYIGNLPTGITPSTVKYF
jgi:hypothetical protein